MMKAIPANIFSAGPVVLANVENGVAVFSGYDLEPGEGRRGVVRIRNVGTVRDTKVADSGNPASGIASVKANVENVTSGQTAVSLVAGSYTVGGIVYNYRSAQLTASNTGSKSYTLNLEDKAGNAASQSFAVTILGAFAGAGFDTANVAGGNEGKSEAGDTVTFSYDSAPAPGSIVSGWSGSAPAAASVTITQSSSNDRLEVPRATALGTVELKGN